MKISSNWLYDYIDTDLSPEELADILTHTGLEVEEVTETGFDFDGIVVGKVISAEKHPNADKLTLCKVDVGDTTLPIVCGAPNVAAGQTVAVATVNSELPIILDNGKRLKIKKSKIRGEVSEGMICAEDELGLGENHDGIMVLDNELSAGLPLSEVFGSDLDHVIEIGLTPNRPDASCHIGCARDIAAVTGDELLLPEATFSPEKSDLGDRIKVSIKDTDKCHRYVGLMVVDVTVQESPDWLKKRLSAIGLRPINNIVDVTNYVLHEMGQPLHSFDYDLLNSKHIIVQSFDKETEFTTLDDVSRKVPSGTLYICDGDQPVALAGIMGGQNSEINPDTKNVLIESAWFEPVGIRKSSKKLALQTDSSYRFERGVDPNLTLRAAVRCAELIAQLGDGTILNGVVDTHPVKLETRKADLRFQRLTDILGTEIERETTVGILQRLGFECEGTDDLVSCTIPSWRPDVNTEIDLIEEIARIFGYNNIPNPDHLIIRDIRPIPLRERFKEEVRHAAQSLSYREIYTNSLLPESFAGALENPDSLVATLNPITKDQALMRPTLTYGFLRSVTYNANRKANSLRFFEIGNVFEKADRGTYVDGVRERTMVLLGVAGVKNHEHWYAGKQEDYQIFDLLADVDGFLKKLELGEYWINRESNTNLSICYGSRKKPLLLAQVSYADKKLTKITDTEIPAFTAEFDFEVLLQLKEKQKAKKYTPIPKFPAFEFDLAVVVGSDVPAGDMIKTIKGTAGNLLSSISVFDVFEGKSLGEGNKSIAFRMQFLSNEKTLTISDVDPIINTILTELGKKYQAALRS